MKKHPDDFIFFNGKDIDEVLKALKQANKPIRADELQKKFLTDWQLLKIESIFDYLINNHFNRFESYEKKNENFNYCALLEYSNKWDDDLAKGGFGVYWEEQTKVIDKIKSVLQNAKVPEFIITQIVNIVLNGFAIRLPFF